MAATMALAMTLTVAVAAGAARSQDSFLAPSALLPG